LSGASSKGRASTFTTPLFAGGLVPAVGSASPAGVAGEVGLTVGVELGVELGEGIGSRCVAVRPLERVRGGWGGTQSEREQRHQTEGDAPHTHHDFTPRHGTTADVRSGERG